MVCHSVTPRSRAVHFHSYERGHPKLPYEVWKVEFIHRLQSYRTCLNLNTSPLVSIFQEACSVSISREISDRGAVDVVQLFKGVVHAPDGLVEPLLDLVNVLRLRHPLLYLVQVQENLLHLILKSKRVLVGGGNLMTLVQQVYHEICVHPSAQLTLFIY